MSSSKRVYITEEAPKKDFADALSDGVGGVVKMTSDTIDVVVNALASSDKKKGK